MKIAVDFDGTCVTHNYPEIGHDIGAIPVLKKMVDDGCQLILFTMRSDNEQGKFLTDAVNWFKENGIELFGIQENPEQKAWTTSPKAYAQLYIDDAGLGAPLNWEPSISDRPFVDWAKVKQMLIDRCIISNTN